MATFSGDSTTLVGTARAAAIAPTVVYKVTAGSESFATVFIEALNGSATVQIRDASGNVLEDWNTTDIPAKDLHLDESQEVYANFSALNAGIVTVNYREFAKP